MEWDIDEAAVMSLFQTRAAVHLSEETVISQAFAMPAGSRAALQRLVARGELLCEDGDPVVYRRPQDSFVGLLRGYVVHAVLGVAVGVLVAWFLQLVGVLEGSLLQPAVTFAVVGLVPVVLLLWREHRHRRQRAVSGRRF